MQNRSIFSIRSINKSRAFFFDRPLTVKNKSSVTSYNSFPRLNPSLDPNAAISFPFRSTFFHAETDSLGVPAGQTAMTPTRCLAPDSIPRLIYTRPCSWGGRRRRRSVCAYISEEFSRFAGNERNAGGKGKRALIKLSRE